MDNANDLELIIRSRIPIVIINSAEEERVLALVSGLAPGLATPVYRWTITEGLQRTGAARTPPRLNVKPVETLKYILETPYPAVYALCDFSSYLEESVNVRLLKEIALAYDEAPRTVILLGHSVVLPDSLRPYSATFDLALPTGPELEAIVREVAGEWQGGKSGKEVEIDPQALEMVVRNLGGLTVMDARRLARNIIYHDGAITREDLPRVMQAKYELLNREGVLTFEYETAQFSDVGGLGKLKGWLEQRRPFFLGDDSLPAVDPPRGVLLLGVQGCGKSLAAKAMAGVFGVPLLRLDFGAVYNKYYGETERNLRETLRTAEVMAPCVLWMDEIEKGLSSSDSDGGVAKRVLGTILTWMAEKDSPVFLVATANDISALPPELIRKGRFDEIFFVDLPAPPVREIIFRIHLKKRDLDPEQFDIRGLGLASEGFSGAEIEQSVVSALYLAHSKGRELATETILEEVSQTSPLSVVMAERIAALRAWAADRTVPSD